ncbi:MAG TPA: dirigent protein [Steroidobacteraceae bacterium]|nr:dirigent protein [Steroidobacteraceae bacterium]
MRRPLRLGVVLAATLVASVAGAAERLALVERATGEKVVPISTAADALGDQLVFSNPLYDGDNRAVVGASRGACVRIEIGRWWDCRFTLELKGGALMVAGAYPDEGDVEFAIIGGTGHYAAAHGTLAVHARDAAHSAYDFKVALR